MLSNLDHRLNILKRKEIPFIRFSGKNILSASAKIEKGSIFISVENNISPRYL